MNVRNLRDQLGVSLSPRKLHSLRHYKVRLRRSQRLRYRLARLFLWQPVSLFLGVLIAAVLYVAVTRY